MVGDKIKTRGRVKKMVKQTKMRLAVMNLYETVSAH